MSKKLPKGTDFSTELSDEELLLLLDDDFKEIMLKDEPSKKMY